MNIFKKIISNIKDILALIVLLLAYHTYELLCYIISNMFPYFVAVAICAVELFLVSLLLIYLHDWFLQNYSWDALKLQFINALREEDNIPPYRLMKRLTRFILRHGFWAVFVFGPVILGPFVVTMLLRRRKTWETMVAYALSGSIFSALFWVAFMQGLGMFTWRYVSIFADKFFY